MKHEEAITTDALVERAPYEIATIDFDEDAGGGFEEADGQSYAIPFLRILQSGSPQCKRSEGAYVEGAQEGMFFNTVTEELTDGIAGVYVVPCYFRRVGTLFTPRNQGGGFKGEVSVAEYERLLPTCTKDDKNKTITPDGLILSDSRNHYVLVLKADGSYVPALISMTSTQIPKSRKWMTQMQSVKLPSGKDAPMFSQVYHLITVPESNKDGSWMGFKTLHEGPVTNRIVYEAAKNFRELVKGGKVRAVDADNGDEFAEDTIPF